ncbi:MAG: ATP-binding protein [Bryobacteraceae bacterium]|jgi:light-regulated signal transduction histidine kinase (bacteriophytochrome)
MDNSNRKRLEAEIESLREALDAETRRRLQLEKRLERASAEFEEFVSTASHNLRESLRAVGSCSQLLAEAYAGRLDSDADLFLGRIQDGVATMQSLLSGVVDYWAAATGDRQPSRTDMEAVLRLALLGAGKQVRDASAIVTHDPLPAVMGDFETLAKLLGQLIGNAIKFRGTLPPRVHISCRREDLEWVFWVEDNGLGIDPAFRDRVFGVFRRLHGKEYPGNGLGLALCKKAIEWHGGRIWMESTPGEGSTVYFTLPPAD